MIQKKICPVCGAENVEDEEFCRVCETPLEKNESSAFVEPQQSDQDEFDLMNADEDDLPSLLHALKHEDEKRTTENEMQEKETSSLQSEDLFESEESQDNEDIPDWLHRIRQRASEEDDSVGEITQKISAAKESLGGSKRSSQHESFESWIQKLRSPTGSVPEDEPEEGATNEDTEEESQAVKQKEPDWLQKIRMAEGKLDSADEQAHLDEGEDGLLNWLAALEDDVERSSPEGAEIADEDEEALDESTQQVETDKSGVTQEIAVEGESLFEVIPPKLNVTQEEKVQADKLASLIMDESAPRPIRKLKRRSKLGAARFFFAILLIVSISLSLSLGKDALTQNVVIHQHTVGFLNWSDTLAQDSPILLVFDYQPAFSSEINLIARPILKTLIEKESKISVLSSSISGPILYRQLFQQISGLEADSITDLGYFPIGAYGAFDLGMGFSANWQITGVPDRSKSLPVDGFDGILIFADTYEGARAWIEQLTMLMPETPINLLVTSQAMPMLVPYFDSGQITGMVSGLDGAAILEKELSQENQTAAIWWAYQVGLLILMIVMVVGAISAGNRQNEEGGQE